MPSAGLVYHGEILEFGKRRSQLDELLGPHFLKADNVRQSGPDHLCTDVLSIGPAVLAIRCTRVSYVTGEDLHYAVFLRIDTPFRGRRDDDAVAQ
jgi:hypothetical protein